MRVVLLICLLESYCDCISVARSLLLRRHGLGPPQEGFLTRRCGRFRGAAHDQRIFAVALLWILFPLFVKDVILYQFTVDSEGEHATRNTRSNLSGRRSPQCSTGI